MAVDGSFQVRQIHADGQIQFQLIGELDMAVADRLLETVQPAIDEGSDVILDLEALTFVDSSGIHTFIEAGQRAAAHGRSVVLRSPSQNALRILEMVGAERLSGIQIAD